MPTTARSERSSNRAIYVEPARPIRTLAEDARAGLLEPPRWIKPKYFYDEVGSQLFDRICETAEYYPTRSELALLNRHSAEIVERTQPEHILELGSGSSRKTRRMLAEWSRHGGEYWPFDVSEEMLIHTAGRLHQDFPTIQVHPLVGDYSGGLTNLPAMSGRTLILFLGGTIGNFTHAEAVGFLDEIRCGLSDGDFVLIGMDRVKTPAIIEAAYNDAAGLTAAFNLNVLSVLNRELGADFRLENFAHRAIYNEPAARIEMYLDARVAHRVDLGELGQTIELAAGESILTEISRKFDDTSARALFAEAGLHVDEVFVLDDGAFSLVLGHR